MLPYLIFFGCIPVFSQHLLAGKVSKHRVCLSRLHFLLKQSDQFFFSSAGSWRSAILN